VTEAVVIAALIGLTGFLVYHFTTHTIRNQRRLVRVAAGVDVRIRRRPRIRRCPRPPRAP